MNKARFNHLRDSKLQKKQGLTMADAYWLNPFGMIFALDEEFKHIDYIIDNPDAFGLAKEQVYDLYDKHGEELYTEGKAREEIIKSLINKGWIRIRYYKKNDTYTLNMNSYNNRNCSYVSSWAEELYNQKKIFSEVKIDVPDIPVKIFSIDDITKGKLYEQPEFMPEGIESGERRYPPLLIEVDSVKQLKPSESSLSSIWKYIKEPRAAFGVVSTNSKEKLEELKKYLSKKYPGCIELYLGYTFKDYGHYPEEKSFLIPNIPLDDLCVIAKEYEQKSFIYKDSESLGVRSADTPNDFVEDSVPLNKGRVLKFSDLKNVFSQLMKSKYGKIIKFAFVDALHETLSEEQMNEAHFYDINITDSKWLRII